MKRQFTAALWKEGKWWVAQCLEVNVASQGRTKEEALENIKEAVELHLTPPIATVLPETCIFEAELRATA